MSQQDLKTVPLSSTVRRKRRSHADELVRLNELSSRLWRTQSLRSGLEEMLSATIELLGADMGHVRMLDSSRAMLIIAAHRGFPADFVARFHEVPVGDTSAAARAIRTRERCVIEDLELDLDYVPLREVAQRAGFRAVQSTPLVNHGGEIVGILSTHWRLPHRPEEHELRKLDLYARQACDFFERCRADDALRASEERYRAVVENQSEMVCRFRMDGTILFANSAYAQALDTTSERLAGANFWDLIPEKDRASVRRQLESLAPHMPLVRIENRFTTDMGERWTLWANRALRFDAAGRVLEAQSTGMDITERKQFEQALRINARRMEALYALTDRLQRSGSLEQVYETAMDAIVKALGCARASILMFDADGVMRFVASRGLSESYRKAVEGHSPWRPEDRDPRPFGIPRLDAADLSEELRAAIRREGIEALAFVPLVNEGRLIGKVMLYCDAPHEFAESEFDVALTIAYQVAFAVQRRRADHALHVGTAQQHAVARMGELALRERDLQRVLDDVTEMVAATLEIDCCNVLELLPGGEELLVRAAHGWKDAVVGETKVGGKLESQAGYTLLSNSAVVVANVAEEMRFKAALLREYGVASGISCIIRGPGSAPWGVLGAHARRRMHFTQDDVSFLESVANILSDAILRHRAEEALRADDRRKDEFLATLSHELRNPLAPLRNALYLLRRADGAGVAHEAIHEMMERQVNHLVRLVDDLLEMSRVSRGAFDLQKERIALATIVRNALETSDPLIKRACHRLDVSLPPEPVWLDGDPVRLAQILSNLLSNAVKYTDDGGEISIAAHVARDVVVITVSDSGIGMAPEVLARAFEMFSRGGRPPGRDEPSLGIGLALARRLAEMHGGTISAYSDGEGKGSAFTVRLPLAADQQPASEAASRQQMQLQPRRILVVDDNRDAADSLGMLLRVLGAEVRIARDGVDALHEFDAYDPAVVLLDIGMPGMDGYEVARRIRKGFPDRRAALVALTGWGQEEDRRRAREAGFDHHLIKPADVETLQVLLSSL